MNNNLKTLLLIVLTGMLTIAPARLSAKKIYHVEPASWWIGFKNPKVQVMIHGDNISSLRPEINYPGVSIQQIISTDNPNYLFLDLVIDPMAKAGSVQIKLKDGKAVNASFIWQLNERQKNSALRQGFDQSDAIYLIMPDRFANGNPDNDDIIGMKETANRNAPYGRHGGDLKGIEDRLDFIAGMGFTALWLNPVLENDQPQSSYHGYAITDYYHIDRRMGSNEDFKKLVDMAKNKGLKIIMDMVFNHCGSEHWWMADLPAKDWINQYPEFTRSNYRLSTVSDPYASQADLDLTTKGWFDTTMPDMNLKNELVLNYFIQNSIWWIEYSGLQGIRMDTYPYPDKNGMAKWMERLNEEYPNFNVVGETWIGEPSKLAYWQKDFPNKDGYNSHLKSLMDFPVAEAIGKAFNESEGWNSGLMRLYNILADDHLYPYPNNMVVFGENHDMGRLAYFLGDDVNKMKMAITFLATVRGIPQWYYGSEILMTGNGADGHANIRRDYPGGWAGDSIDAFKPEGRTNRQNDIFNHLTNVFNYRKHSPVLQKGKTMHFIPENDIYVYFRYLDKNAVMVVLNNNDEAINDLQLNRFAEILNQYQSGKDILSGETLPIKGHLSIPAKSGRIIELKQ
jgi:glycosidase